MGLEIQGTGSGDPAGSPPIDESEKQNMTPLLAGVPAYIVATFAAGATIASGGTLAGAAVAALLGSAGGEVIGAGAAGLFRNAVDEEYAEQLAHGGPLLLVHPRSSEDLEHARTVLAQHAAQQIETLPDRSIV